MSRRRGYGADWDRQPRCLSLTRPWPYTILHLGKRIENRSHAQFSRFRGPLLLHAALSWDNDVGEWCVGRGFMRADSKTPEVQGVMLDGQWWHSSPDVSRTTRRRARSARDACHPSGIVGLCKVVGCIAPWVGGPIPHMEVGRQQVVFLHTVCRPDLAADQGAAVTLDGVAVAERAAFNDELDMRWWMGGYALVLADVVAFDKPIPCKGRLGLWRPPADVLAQLPEAA